MKAVLRDLHTTVTRFSPVLVLLFFAANAVAQSTTPRPVPTPTPSFDGLKSSTDAPLTTYEEELRAKNAIKLAQKDHQANLERAREIGELGKHLLKGLSNKSSIDRQFLKKIERLEKLTKKVRGEAGGEDEEVDIPNRPSDITAAVIKIAEVSESLAKDVEDTPRQVVSTSVISNANVLLELIKILRAFAR